MISIKVLTVVLTLAGKFKKFEGYKKTQDLKNQGLGLVPRSRLELPTSGL